MIRVLIVEDSKTYATAIRSIVEHAGGFEVVGVAEDGEEGLEKTHELGPDVVLMDVNMPRMDGLEATERIMAEKPTPILLMTAAENLERDVDLGFRAIDRGALDLIPKPQQLGDGARKLTDRLRLIAGVPVITHPRGRARKKRKLSDSGEGKRVESRVVRRARRIVAVVASTGGPRALRVLLELLPPDLPAAVAIVQHIDGAFTDGLVRWLGDGIALGVAPAIEGQALQEGLVVVAPSGVHLEITRERRAALVPTGPGDGSHVPSGNRLLTSVARAYGKDAVGVVLTGMGDDGARGLAAIRSAGGITIAQDEATSVVYGMPKAARDLGAVQQVLPLPLIADAVVTALRQ